ncbi:MAG: O-antigen ligase family protein [Aeromicrobium sp.]|nr:O-antigen ligase family protein [Aeromicrobium sp.]
MTDRLERASVWLLAATAALVAAATGNLTMFGIGDGALLYDTIALPRLVVATIGVLLIWTLWAAGARRGPATLRFDVTWALLGTLAVWGLVSAALSPHRALSVLGQSERLEGAVTLAMYVLAYGATLQVVRGTGAARRVLAAIAASAVALACHGLVQYAGLDPASYTLEAYGFDLRRAFSTFGNPNFFGGLLVLALPLVVGLALTARRPAARTAWTAGVLVVTAALFATFTRSAWLAVFAQAVVGVWLWRRASRVGPRTIAPRTWAALAAAAVLVVGLVGLSLAAEGETNVITRLTDGFSGTGSASERSLLIGVSAAAVAERPVLGHGPDAFLPAFRAHRSDAYVEAFGAEATVNNAHSWPLQYAVTLGVPGALLLLAVVASGLWSGRGVLRRLTGRPVRGASARGPAADAGAIMLTAAWLGCLGFAVQMLFNVGVLGATVPFFIMLAIAGAPSAREARVRPVAPVAIVAVSGVLLLASVGASASLLSADATYLAARDRYHGAAFEESAVLAERAVSGNPPSVKYARGAAQARGQGALSAMADGAPDADVRVLHDEAGDAYARVLALAPADYPAHAWYAALQARVGTHLGDDDLVRSAIGIASEAAVLDRQHASVQALAEGDVSPNASGRAATVPPLR